MATSTLKDATGAKAGTVELDDAIFGIEPNVPVMHQVVTAQLATGAPAPRPPRPAPRSAAAVPSPGSRRAPAAPARAPAARRIWVGGGVALGPKPRSYAQRTPKKMIRLALRSALSDRAADGKVLVVDGWGLEAPSTKGALAALAAIGVTGRVLVVLGPTTRPCPRASATCITSTSSAPGELNAYDVLVQRRRGVFTPDTLPVDAVRSSPGATSRRAAAAAAAEEAS